MLDVSSASHGRHPNHSRSLTLHTAYMAVPTAFATHRPAPAEARRTG